jgi:ABC-type transport system involved in cytochrome bd biosynthesis fused ATPase/permease subunit
VAALVRSEPLGTPLALTAALLLTRGLLAAAGEVTARQASLRVVAEVRSRLLRRWLGRRHGSRPRSTQEVTLAGAGLDSVEPYVARYLPALVTAAVVPTLAVVVLLWVDPWSALIVVLTMPLLPLFAALIGLHTAERARRRLSTLHELSGHFLDVVRGLPTLVR